MSLFRRAPEPVVITPKPKPIAAALEHVRRVPSREAPSQVLIEQYTGLLTRIGAPYGPVWDFKMETFLRTQGWEILDPISVDLYMRGVCERLAYQARVPHANVTWTWRELPYYTLAIPMRVLERMALIQQEFGKGYTNFQVTEVQYRSATHPIDPFIRVATNRGNQFFIFDVWDEPGFTG